MTVWGQAWQSQRQSTTPKGQVWRFSFEFWRIWLDMDMLRSALRLKIGSGHLRFSQIATRKGCCHNCCQNWHRHSVACRFALNCYWYSSFLGFQPIIVEPLQLEEMTGTKVALATSRASSLTTARLHQRHNVQGAVTHKPEGALNRCIPQGPGSQWM